VTPPPPPRDGPCFFEADLNLSLARRAAAEAIGSFLLVFTLVAATAVWTGGVGTAAIGRAMAIGPALTALILTFGQVSGGHYNPLISLAQWISGRRASLCLVAYMGAQILGAALAARLALFTLNCHMPAALSPPTTQLLAAEVFATTGLMMIVLATPRMRPAGIGPFAVGAWISMSIVGLPADPAANPAITVAALASGFGAPFSEALLHLVAQATGLALAIAFTYLTTTSGEIDHVH
jgi:glycerol uptake facilitator-like aquaporin